jgi:hypothetical protein
LGFQPNIAATLSIIKDGATAMDIQRKLRSQQVLPSATTPITTAPQTAGTLISAQLLSPPMAITPSIAANRLRSG